MSSPVFFGVAAALFSIVPHFGILVGALLSAAYLPAAGGPLWLAGAVIALFTVLQVVEGNVISPKLFGESTGLNPFVVLLVLLAGSALWGAAGLVLAVPCAGILKLVFDEVEPLRPLGFLLGGEREDER